MDDCAPLGDRTRVAAEDTEGTSGVRDRRLERDAVEEEVMEGELVFVPLAVLDDEPLSCADADAELVSERGEEGDTTMGVGEVEMDAEGDAEKVMCNSEDGEGENVECAVRVPGREEGVEEGEGTLTDGDARLLDDTGSVVRFVGSDTIGDTVADDSKLRDAPTLLVDVAVVGKDADTAGEAEDEGDADEDAVALTLGEPVATGRDASLTDTNWLHVPA